jgi:hypothetical protein
MNIKYLPYIKIFDDYLKKIEGATVDYCGISNQDDFSNYESLITFKYKSVDTSFQFSKICRFISEHKDHLHYDWYIKTRPDLKLLSPLNFSVMSDTSINARARQYTGPKTIKYGMSINGNGKWRNIGNCFYDPEEKHVVLDDMIYIFHNNVVKREGFSLIFNHDSDVEDEWYHSLLWKSRNISFNVIGINAYLSGHDVFSGNIPYAFSLLDQFKSTS